MPERSPLGAEVVIGHPFGSGRSRAGGGALAGPAETTERVAGIERTLEAGAGLGERIEAARTDLALAERLRDDLQPSRFLAWLLGEERAALAELASVHLEALTDGDFRFTDDETFHIVDVNAGGTVRAPDSLSGGETFLASLALALALSEQVRSLVSRRLGSRARRVRRTGDDVGRPSGRRRRAADH